ncbi:MAG: helix-turn-helix domain-containing protein [Roseburia sp.]|nr:helix-turn-helix domain-containing protein [Ruminococcus sp.]MCM1154198.1 helix-turn-helix domain-containing protein [Roseburia sp.]MCM1241324.1 helix-turn-helix domain-containing protein [Roseburia sp.]
MDRIILGKRLREERIRSGLTQEQTAEYINVSTSYIGLIERGERSVTLEKIILLADCFHVSVDCLLQDFLPSSPSIDEKQMLLLWNSATEDEKSIILSVIKSILNHSSKK